MIIRLAAVIVGAMLAFLPTAAAQDPAPALISALKGTWTGEIVEMGQRVTRTLVIDSIQPQGASWIVDATYLSPGGERLSTNTVFPAERRSLRGLARIRDGKIFLGLATSTVTGGVELHLEGTAGDVLRGTSRGSGASLTFRKVVASQAVSTESDPTRVKTAEPVAVALDLRGPAAADVRIDGRPFTLDPQGRLSILLKPGTYAVEASKPGFMPWRQTLVLKEGVTPPAVDVGLVALAPTPVTPRAALPSGERYAVVIGIGDYDATAIPRLKFATRDADAVYDVLTTRAGFKKENVVLLTDRTQTRPTLRAIKSALGTFLARNARPQDTVLVFFAGHGAPEIDLRNVERDGLAKYLIPIDADPNDLYATALSMEEIGTIFGRLEAQRVVMFLDACYSGAAGGRTFVSQRVGTRTLSVDELFLDRLTSSKGRAIMTASRSSEVSIELAELGHGLFSYYLVEGLKGAADGNRDGIVTLQELYEYVERTVARKSRAVGGNQHPVLKGELEGIIPLVRVAR